MTRNELIRWYRKFKYDPKYRDANGSRTVPFRVLCDWAGVARQQIYLVIHGRAPLSENCDVRMTAAIEAVKKGMRWRRENQVWKLLDPKFERLPRYQNPRDHRDQVGDHRMDAP